MNNYEKIKALVEENNGILYVKELEKHNIHRQYLKILEERGYLTRIIKGLYVKADKDINEFFITGERYKTGIFSHNTALYFYNLTDRTPMNLDMTFPSTIRVSNTTLYKKRKSLIRSHNTRFRRWNNNTNLQFRKNNM